MSDGTRPSETIPSVGIHTRPDPPAPSAVSRHGFGAAPRGRHLLACASAGGHFKQLVALVDRIPNLDAVTWLTHDQGMSTELLEQTGHGSDRVVHTVYAAPRDLPNLARNAVSAWQVLGSDDFDLAVSTGAGIAVATLPLARLRGVRAVFIESATRSDSASLSGRILAGIPGIEIFAQNPGLPTRWPVLGSVHDRFEPGPDRAPRLERVVVTTGTIRPYGFRRLVQQLVEVLPASTEVVWQTGETDLTGLDVDGRARVPAIELEAAMEHADVVVAHAGTGTALTAFELGISPVLVPRRRRYGEHVDDHQVPTARTLAERGLATHLEVEELTIESLLAASRRTVVAAANTPPLQL